MKQENCHEKASENASAQFLATARRPRTHRARILPRTVAHGRTTAKYRRRRTSGDAIREHLAIGERRGNVSRHDLATTGRSRRMSCPTAPVRPTAPNAPRPMPQRHVPQRYASQRHRCSRRTLPLMPHVPDAHSLAPPAAALRCHAPYAVLLPPLKK